MKKSAYFITILLLLSMVLSAAGQNNEGIKFRTASFDEAIALSKSEKKPIFLHAFASWCHYCEYMTDSVYSKKEIGDFYNRNFICIRMDMEKEGRELNKKLKVRTFPTLVYFDYRDIVMMHRIAGKRSAEEFLQTGKEALDSTKQLRTYEKKYYNKTAKAEEILTYFRMLDKAGLDNQAPINAYLMNIDVNEMLKPINWRIMYDLFREADLPAFQKVIENKKYYAEKYSADSIENKIISVYNYALMNRVQQLDSAGYENMISKLRNSNLDLRDKIISYAELNKVKMKSEWLRYEELAIPFIEKYCMNDYRRLNEVAANFYERVGHRESLLKAEDWARKAVTMADNVRHNHTLAGLCYKLGKKTEALQAAKHAIELGQQKGVDVKQTVLLLEKIEEMP
jgi:thioredoxin-related protein